MYIYKITNLINNKIYIGQTIQTVKQRFNQHCNCKNMLIGKAIRKHGRENFKIEVVNEFTTIDELNYFEQYYISLFNTICPDGYNLHIGGLNDLHLKSTLDKMSKINSEKLNSLNYKYKNSSSAYFGVKKRGTTFMAFCLVNKKPIDICCCKSEKWCAYMYDQYCIENNIIKRKLNNLSYEEAYGDYRKYYDENGLSKEKSSKYKHVTYSKKNKKFIAQMQYKNKQYGIGYFETEIEAVKAVNKFIVDNNIDKPLLIIQ